MCPHTQLPMRQAHQERQCSLANGLKAVSTSILEFRRAEKHTESKHSRENCSEDEKGESNDELAVLADGRQEWSASSTLPDLMQRRIHRRGCAKAMCVVEGCGRSLWDVRGPCRLSA